MKTDLDEQRSRLNAVAMELDVAKERIRDLERRRKHTFFRQLVVIICASVAAAEISSWAQAPKQPSKLKPKPAAQTPQPAKTTRFTAPFEIVDSEGQVIIMVVDEHALPPGAPRASGRGVYLYTKGGANSVAMRAPLDGGVVEVQEKGQSVDIAAFSGRIAMSIQDRYAKDSVKVEITNQSAQLVAPFQVLNAARKPVFKTNDSSD